MKEFDPTLMQATDARDDLFLPVPVVLFENAEFAGLSPAACIVYGFLKMRMQDAALGGDLHADGRGLAFVYFPATEMAAAVSIPVPAVIGAYRELEACYLIRRVTEQDTGRERIYLSRIGDARKRLAREITEAGRGRGE